MTKHQWEVMTEWKLKKAFLEAQLNDGLITLEEFFDVLLTISVEAKERILLGHSLDEEYEELSNES